MNPFSNVFRNALTNVWKNKSIVHPGSGRTPTPQAQGQSPNVPMSQNTVQPKPDQTKVAASTGVSKQPVWSTNKATAQTGFAGNPSTNPLYTPPSVAQQSPIPSASISSPPTSYPSTSGQPVPWQAMFPGMYQNASQLGYESSPTYKNAMNMFQGATSKLAGIEGSRLDKNISNYYGNDRADGHVDASVGDYRGNGQNAINSVAARESAIPLQQQMAAQQTLAQLLAGKQAERTARVGGLEPQSTLFNNIAPSQFWLGQPGVSNSLMNTTNTSGYNAGLASAQSFGIPRGAFDAMTQGATPGFNQNLSNQNASSFSDRTGQYNSGLTVLNQAKGLRDNIFGTLNSFPDLNNTPVTALGNLSQLLAGQTSGITDPGKQRLARQIGDYVKSLGYSPDYAASIANQSRGTLRDLLNNLYTQKQTENEGLNPATSQYAGGGRSWQAPWGETITY